MASAGGLVWLSILVKALAYGATLLASGAVLATSSLRGLRPAQSDLLRHLGVGAALVAILASIARIPLQASFLMGGTWAGAFDPTIMALVADGPLGISIALRVAGMILICALIVPTRAGLWLALAGAGLAAASFVLRGHTVSEPRLLLAPLLMLHLLCIAFWIGGLPLLVHATRHASPAEAGALAHEFGRKALFAVGALATAGVGVAVLLGEMSWPALTGSYGQALAAKLVAFGGLLALAAVNKLRLTPALRDGQAMAARRLRVSVFFELALIAAILLVTGTMTTLSSPGG